MKVAVAAYFVTMHHLFFTGVQYPEMKRMMLAVVYMLGADPARNFTVVPFMTIPLSSGEAVTLGMSQHPLWIMLRSEKIPPIIQAVAFL